MEPRFKCQGTGEIGLLYLRVHYIENLNVCYIKGWLLTFVVVGFFFFLLCDIVLFSILGSEKSL